MIHAVEQPLRVFRNDPFIATMVVTGIDLTGAAMAMTVRRYPDEAGAALLTLASGASAGAQGIRFIHSVNDVDGIPESFVEIIALKAAIQALPVPPEAGDEVELFYDFQITPPADASTIWTDNIEQTAYYGSFIVKGSASA